MQIKFENASLFKDGKFHNDSFYSFDISGIASAVSYNNCFILPGFIDVHVHLREPGFSYKETIETGTKAAARGGYTAVCSMPNLNPTPDCVQALDIQIEKINKDAVIDVFPYGTITVGENGQKLSDMKEIADKCIAFSDDGKGVQNRQMMLDAMLTAKKLGKIIVAHCEDNSLLHGGYIHDGDYAKTHNHKGICSESEWAPIKRDIELVRQTGCSYHVCHISTKESVQLIRAAKAEGLDITCETAPHYLVLNDTMLQEDGRFKMNPPIRSEEDRLELIKGIQDGTIDMIATDHAPHSLEEKSKGLKDSLMGVVGIETSFAVLYTNLVKKGIITLERLIELMSLNPAKRFNIKQAEDFSVWDLNQEYTINPEKFLSKGKSTPFDKAKVFGKCLLTVKNGKAVWNESNNTEV